MTMPFRSPSTLVLPMPQAQDTAARVLRAALEVHQGLGPALELEHYQRGLSLQLRAMRLGFERDARVDLCFRGESLGQLRADFLFPDCLAQVIAAPQIDDAQLSRTRALVERCGCGVGLVLNFGIGALEAKRVFPLRRLHAQRR